MRQAAEIAVLRLLAEIDRRDVEGATPRLALMDATDDEGSIGVDVEVQHPDGRRWNVHVTRRLAALASPSSCGKAAEFGYQWVAATPRLLDVRQDVGRDDDSRL